MANKYKLCHEYQIFSDLTREQMETIRILCREECFYPGYTLFEEGQPATKMYVLVEGDIEIFFTLSESGMACVDRIGQGEILGCSALVPPYLHASTARAQTRIEVLELDAAALRVVFESDPKMAASIQQHVIRGLLNRIVDLRLG